MYIILIYDITANKMGAKITRNVFKIAKKYLFHIQNSVFEGELDEVKLTQLKRELSTHIRQSDSCILFKSRNKKWLKGVFNQSKR